jgi:ribose/xylose/arabinose/galactoside ABC-type transport system permease subunit
VNATRNPVAGQDPLPPGRRDLRMPARVRHVVGFAESGILLALIVVVVGFALIEPVFLTTQNLADIARNAAFTFIAASMATYVFAAAGLDLSVGSVLGVGALVGGLLIVDAGAPVPVGILGAMAAGAVVGTINGVIIVKGHIPALVATLGMLYAARGVIMIVTEGEPIFPFPTSFTEAVSENVAGVPVMALVAGAIAVAAHVTLRYTRFGREMLATGGNRDAARLAGIRVDRVSITVYVLAGAAAALTGVLLAARLGTAQASAGTGYELIVIAAVIIGGTSLFGGSATVIGTVIGALLLATLTNGMTVVELSPFYQNVVVGAVIVLAVAIDQWRRRRGLTPAST